MDELCGYKQGVEKQLESKNQRLEKVNTEMIEFKDLLAKANEKLINSVETEIQLRKNVSDITSAGEADRKMREQVEMDLRVLAMQQSSDLIEFNCKHQRMIEQKDFTMNKLVDAAREDKRTATEYIDRLNTDMKTLAMEKDNLIAELNIRDKTQCLLRARVVELEDLLMVNMKNINEKMCLISKVPSQGVENTMCSIQLECGDNYPQSRSEWSTEDSQLCCTQWLVDNKQPCRLSRSIDNITTTDECVQPCLLSITNIEDDDHNISSEYSQTEPVKEWHVIDLMKKYQTENN